MQKILLITICSLTSFTIAQEISIKVNNFEGKKVAISFLTGENISVIDSITAINEYEYHFSLENNHSGVYRLSFTNKNWLHFVYDNEDVEIETDANNILDSLKVVESESNRNYYAFVELSKNYKAKTELLQIILARYPQEDDYYQITKEKLVRVRDDYQNFVIITSQSDPSSFVARYVRTVQLPIVGVELALDDQLSYLKSHALDNVDFYDDGLIFSDAFTTKSIEYLTYYHNPQLSKELLEEEFIIAVDTILTKAKVNPIVYQHIVEYLIDGFRKFGFDQSIDYIVQNYVIKDDLCLDAKLESSIDRRIAQARNFKIGSTVPNIIIENSSGMQIELNKINSEQILILFYASWCPHCQSLLPQINDLYKNQRENNTEVFAVSIDTTKSGWMNFIETNNLNWINISDLNGWNGKTAKDYYLYATPTMILIDREQKIIAKPSNISDLKEWF